MSKKEIKEKIKKCKVHKKNITYYNEQLKNQYKKGLISYKEYNRRLNEFLKNKNAKEWHDYYDKEILRLEIELKQFKLNKFVLPIVLVLLAIVVVGINLNLFTLRLPETEASVFEKPALIELSNKEVYQNEKLTILFNPTSSGIYKEVYFYKGNNLMDKKLLNCEDVTCYDQKMLQYIIPEDWVGRYSVNVFDYSSNDYVKEEFNVKAKESGQVKFDRDLDCHKCGKHKAPPNSIINMSISAGKLGMLEDYYPSSWQLINENNGIVESVNESYNKVSWNNKDKSWYLIKSPERTTPSTKYEFYSKLDNEYSEPWMVVVADPLSGIVLNLKDNFDDNSRDSTKWVIGTLSDAGSPDVTVVETNQHLEIRTAIGKTGINYNGYVSTNNYDFTNKEAFIDVVKISGRDNQAYTQFNVGSDSSNKYEVIKRYYLATDTDQLIFRKVKGGIVDDSTPVKYDIVMNRWWKIAHDTSTNEIVWLTSADGENWIESRRATEDIGIGNIKISLNAGTEGSVSKADTETVIFDNFNLKKLGKIKRVSELVDHFGDNKIDRTRWINDTPKGDGSINVDVHEVNKELRIIPPINAPSGSIQYNGYYSIDFYNLTNDNVTVSVPEATIGTEGVTTFSVGRNNTYRYMIFKKSGPNIVFRKIIGGVPSDVSKGYVSTTHRWWRIGHIASENKIVWATSPDGIVWTLQRKENDDLAIDKNIIGVGLHAGREDTVSSPGQARFDNLNNGFNLSLRPNPSGLNDVIIAILDNTEGKSYTNVNVCDYQGCDPGGSGNCVGSPMSVLGDVDDCQLIPDTQRNGNGDLYCRFTSWFGGSGDYKIYSCADSSKGTENLKILDEGPGPQPEYINVGEDNITLVFTPDPIDSGGNLVRATIKASPVNANNVNICNNQGCTSANDGNCVGVVACAGIDMSRDGDGNLYCDFTAPSGIGVYGYFACLRSSITPNIFQHDEETLEIKNIMPVLNVTLLSPEQNAITVYQNDLFWLNTSVTCLNEHCSNVESFARENISSVRPDFALNASRIAKPFYIYRTVNANESIVNSTWNMTTDPTIGSSDTVQDVAIDSQNNIIEVGHVGISPNKNWNITKLGPDGSKIWQKIYSDIGNIYDDRVYGIRVLKDDSMIVTGSTNGVGTSSGDWHIKKLDKDGNQIWEQTYNVDLTRHDQARMAAIDDYNNIIVVGYTDASGSSSDWHIKKLRSDGTEIWQQTYNIGTGGDYAYNVALDSQNNIIVVGEGKGSDKQAVIKKLLSIDGSEVWERSFDLTSPGRDSAYESAINKNDYAIIATGQYFHVIKLDKDGNIIYSKDYPPFTGNAYGISLDTNENYIVVGDLDGDKTRIMKFDRNDKSIWNFTFDRVAGSLDQLGDVVVDNKNDFITVGTEEDARWLTMKFKNYLGACGLLDKDKKCNVSWQLRATGLHTWQIDSLFKSRDSSIEENSTKNVNVTIGIQDINLIMVDPYNNVDFRDMNLNEEDNTLDNDPTPFILRNEGSSNVDVSVVSTQLFSGTNADTTSSYYQVKADKAGATTNIVIPADSCNPVSCFDEANSVMTFTNVPISPDLALNLIAKLKGDSINDANDEAKVDIKLTIPGDEPSGIKQATVTFTATASTGFDVEETITRDWDDVNAWGTGSGYNPFTPFEWMGYSNAEESTGLRFNSVDIPQGASIKEAYIRFVASESLSNVPNLDIKGENSDNAQPFDSGTGNRAEYDGRPRTINSVSWSPSAWTLGNTYDSPDIANVIQEIVNRPGWQADNSLIIFVEYSSPASSNYLRKAASYEDVNYNAPYLLINYA